MLTKSAKASVEYLKMAEERRSKLAALLAGRIIKSLMRKGQGKGAMTKFATNVLLGIQKCSCDACGACSVNDGGDDLMRHVCQASVFTWSWWPRNGPSVRH